VTNNERKLSKNFMCKNEWFKGKVSRVFDTCE
jgi:hypothetical protein